MTTKLSNQGLLSSVVGRREAAGNQSSWRSSACLLAILFSFFLFPLSSAWGHHSVTQFDSTQEKVLEGTVIRMEWTNPHVWIRLHVEGENGDVVEWGVEASNPLQLGRKGWSKKSFQEGDLVKIAIHPARNGRPFGAFVRAVLADGTQLSEI